MKAIVIMILFSFSVKVFGNCEQGKAITGYIRPLKDLQMYTKPSASSKKVMNERASWPRIVNQDYELAALCETKGWVKGSITKADGDYVNWETGWIQKNGVSLMVTSTMEIRKPATNNNDCVSKGIKFYKDIGSYPILTNGKRAEDLVKTKCNNHIGAFN